MEEEIASEEVAEVEKAGEEAANAGEAGAGAAVMQMKQARMFVGSSSKVNVDMVNDASFLTTLNRECLLPAYSIQDPIKRRRSSPPGKITCRGKVC